VVHRDLLGRNADSPVVHRDLVEVPRRRPGRRSAPQMRPPSPAAENLSLHNSPRAGSAEPNVADGPLQMNQVHTHPFPVRPPVGPLQMPPPYPTAQNLTLHDSPRAIAARPAVDDGPPQMHHADRNHWSLRRRMDQGRVNHRIRGREADAVALRAVRREDHPRLLSPPSLSPDRPIREVVPFSGLRPRVISSGRSSPSLAFSGRDLEPHYRDDRLADELEQYLGRARGAKQLDVEDVDLSTHEKDQCNDKCPICLDNCTDDLVRTRRCNHIFHRECLTKSVASTAANSDLCPMCREPCTQ